ncbi:MAG: helix-turn-helix transcriptional regulator [Treponema sp.]|nr:helix-turn-helix transcriptional regulator [Treponema sp.]
MSRSTEMKGENDIFDGISFWNKKELLAYISALMSRKGLTASDIDGKNAGYVEKGTWYQIQSGKNPPNPKTARRLVFALHCTIDEADEFLSLCGMKFVDGNEIDTCLKTCIQNEIYKWSEVQNNIHKVLSESATKSNSF